MADRAWHARTGVRAEQSVQSLAVQGMGWPRAAALGMCRDTGRARRGRVKPPGSARPALPCWVS